MNNTKSLFDFIYLKVALCPLWLKSLVSISVHSWFNFVAFVSFVVNCKTNPKRTQTNPIFPRPNPILSPKTGIFDKFRKTFLCKTNPMVCYILTNFSLMNNNLFPFLARRFAYPARPKACDKRRCTIVLRVLSAGRRTPPGSKYTAKRQKIPNKANLNNYK